MKRKISTLFGIFILIGCQEKEFLTPEVRETSIEKNNEVADLSFPFAELEELNQYKGSSDVIYYEKARKFALLEAQLSGYVKDVNWSGYHLSQKPIIIYDFNSKPRFYDFIALDTENNPIGTIRVNATKNDNTSIKSIHTKTFNYNELLSKSSINNPSFFMDWKGSEFVGIKSKSGEAPMQIVSTETGEAIPQNEIRELKGQEIIDYLTENVFPALLPKDGRTFESIPFHLKENDTIKEEIKFVKTLNINTLKDSLQANLLRKEKEAEAFWEAIAEVEPELATATDEEINNTNSKFFGRIFRWVRRVFNFNTNKDIHVIEKYGDHGTIADYGRLGQWCGPWVCGYIVRVNQGVDKYDFFESCAGTFGELGILNFSLRIFGRPMTPAEMSWSMPIASKGKIWISPIPHMADLHAYDHIRYRGKPALRLLVVGGQFHWTLAYGAVASGSYFWRNYKFLQIDNGTLIDNRRRGIRDEINYTAISFWEPWFLVWD